MDIVLGSLPTRCENILEIGAGRGLLSVELAERGSVTALDLSPVAMAAASERWPHIAFLAGDFLEMPISGSFDAIVAAEVIEHVENQRAFVEKAASLLAPGGTLILTTPQKWVAKWWAKQPGSFLQPIENWLSAGELRRLVAPHLTVESVEPFCYHAVYAGPFRLLNGRLSGLSRALRIEERLGWGMHLALVAKAHSSDQIRPATMSIAPVEAVSSTVKIQNATSPGEHSALMS